MIIFCVCYSMAQSPLKTNGTLSWSRYSPPFTEPEGAIPCSQEPATGPYPEPDESNKSLLLLPYVRLGLPCGLQTKIL
jgi:hypothetical protein